MTEYSPWAEQLFWYQLEGVNRTASFKYTEKHLQKKKKKKKKKKHKDAFLTRQRIVFLTG